MGSDDKKMNLIFHLVNNLIGETGNSIGNKDSLWCDQLFARESYTKKGPLSKTRDRLGGCLPKYVLYKLQPGTNRS